MIAEGLLLPITILENSASHDINEQEIWLVKKNENNYTRLQIRSNKMTEVWVCDEDSLLLLDQATLTVESGTLVYRKVRIEILCKLIAFIDETYRRSYFIGKVDNFMCIPCVSTIFTNSTQCEIWFLSAYITKEKWVYSLCNLVRRTECYGLTRYLLSKSMSKIFLHELGKAYGVSYSHFRRLCGSALCGKVKSQLSKWRMASAVLEVIEGNTNITTIAYKNGYSSSSHFSSELKSYFGMTPKDLCKK